MDLRSSQKLSPIKSSSLKLIPLIQVCNTFISLNLRPNWDSYTVHICGHANGASKYMKCFSFMKDDIISMKKKPSQLTSSESSTAQLSSSICKRNNLFIFKFIKFFAISTEDGCMISKWHADCRPWPTIKSQTMVFCYQNSSDLLWEKKCSSDWKKLLKFEAEGREFSKFLRSLE